MSKLSYGKLYLIPSPLCENTNKDVLPQGVIECTRRLKVFIVEELRTARRYLSTIGFKGTIDSLQFYLLNEHSTEKDLESLLHLFRDGNDVGLISEAGMPAIADPGADLVALCHRHNIEVIPLVGPSSILLALVASGMNGQSFCFHGYLPAKTEQRKSKIKELEKLSKTNKGQSQIFIETPYRNEALLSDLLALCQEDTRLCIAKNITMNNEKMSIRTKSIREWRALKPSLIIGKYPCVFLLSQQF